uniref:Cro/C1-type HTH DNA-binding domain n=1 Tax=Dulem virus 39 TaxID=3145757 RepID=A0AAU8B5W7_9CAUD
MIDKEKLREISLTLTSNQDNYMAAFRENLFKYISDKGITIKDISEKSGIPFPTLNSFLYGSVKDMMLANVIKLSRALNISVDELVGAGTIGKDILNILKIYRNLPEHSQYLVEYFVNHQRKIFNNSPEGGRRISVFVPECKNGNLLATNMIEHIDIVGFSENFSASTYVGIKIPCDCYMPYYAPGDIILIAADRHEREKERCVINHNGNIYIVNEIPFIENGKRNFNYTALMNNNLIIPKDNLDDKIGYIIGFLKPDGSLGIR